MPTVLSGSRPGFADVVRALTFCEVLDRDSKVVERRKGGGGCPLEWCPFGGEYPRQLAGEPCDGSDGNWRADAARNVVGPNDESESETERLRLAEAAYLEHRTGRIPRRRQGSECFYCRGWR